MTLSAIAFTIAYCYLPPEEGDWQADFDKANPGTGLVPRTSSRTGGKHAYASFERDLPKLKSNQGHKLFCLETACRLLEVSEQSYFRPTLLHIEAIGAYPLTITDKLHLEKERTLASSDTSLRRQRQEQEQKQMIEDEQAENTVVINPFDEGYDEGVADAASTPSAINKKEETHAGSGSNSTDAAKDEHFVNSASKFKMNLEPCGLQLLSLFHDNVYQNLGFVARALPSTLRGVDSTSSSRTRDMHEKPFRLSTLQ